VRALVENNDIAGTGYVAGGAIFLSMYEYAGLCDRSKRNTLYPSRYKVVRRLD
jgi:hypothetical protein